MAVICIHAPLRQGGGWALGAAQNRAGARRFATRPLRCSDLRPAGKLAARLRRSAQTLPASQFTKRAARAAASPAPGPGGPGLRQAQTVLRTVCVRAQPLGRLDIRRPEGPPAALQAPWWRATGRIPSPLAAKGCAGVAGRAYAAPRSARRLGRARSALRALTWEGVSEWHERSECNELPDRPRRPSIAGQSTRSGDRRIGAPRHARTGLCRAHARTSPRGHRTTAMLREQPAPTCARTTA
jgi:hypothetical protein